MFLSGLSFEDNYRDQPEPVLGRLKGNIRLYRETFLNFKVLYFVLSPQRKAFMVMPHNVFMSFTK